MNTNDSMSECHYCGCALEIHEGDEGPDGEHICDRCMDGRVVSHYDEDRASESRQMGTSHL